MKRSSFFLTGLLVMFLVSSRGNAQFAVSGIHPELLKNANAVIRLEEEYTELQALDKLLLKRHYVVTILNEKGERFADLVEQYDKFNEIRSIEGNLFDANGTKLKSLKSKDLRDESAYSESLAEDARFKQHNFYYKVFPYTVEYIIEKVKKETMFLPTWQPVWEEFVSVQKSVFQIRVPKDYLVRYKAFNYGSEPQLLPDGEKKLLSWELKNYPAIQKEYASPAWREITPHLMLGPSLFSIDGYKGNMTNWSELGRFQSSLNKGRDVLPPALKQKVAEIIKDAPTAEEKVARLYRFMQANTRYISIQLGIGGWRPFEAADVASKAYGDCKALSNYMTALLSEAGIRSHYTLVRAGGGESDIVIDFPSRQFNHAIVCVPNGKDSIWLECTSQTDPPGYMGGFTGNRHALLITDEGGKLVATPRYGLNENLQIRRVRAVLDENATLRINSGSSYTGIQQDRLHMVINNLSKDKVKEHLEENLDFATYDITSFNYKERKNKIPTIEESLEIEVSNYATITGKRLFIVPNVMTRSYRKLSADSARKYDLNMGFEFKDVDTVEIKIPPGYTTESVPQEINIQSKFGKYHCSVKVVGDLLNYYRSYEHYSGRFPSKDYMELVKFYDAVYKADRNRVVLVKNQSQ